MRTLSMFAGFSLLIAVGCRVSHLTSEEARESLDESSVASQAEALTAASVEISTDFTIGQAVENAAAEIRSFVQTQLPCAEITLREATLTIEYGVQDGNCIYRGHEFSGSHEIRVERNEDSDVVVHHRWDALSNGRLSVTGEATVTWSRSARSRHIVHELSAEPRPPLREVLAEVIREVRPSPHTRKLEYMDLVAVKECTDARFLPPQYRDLSPEELENRIDALRRFV
jgi:hypothetical protein